MKKVIKKSIITAVLLSTLLSNANEGSSFIPKKENDIAKTMVTISDVKEGQGLIIKDHNGFVLYKELIKETGIYNKSFDLTALPDGDYFFEVDKEVKIQSIPFNVASNIVTFNKDMETTIYKPFVRVNNNYIYLNKLALNEEPLKVEIYYEGNEGGSSELIHSETIEHTVTIGRAYKLLKNVHGKYKVVMTSNNRTFYEYLTI